jgi:hypothetical protein
VKKNKACYYCGKLGHYSKDCGEKKFHWSKNRRHEGNFLDKEATINDNFKNLKFFISYATLSIETYNVWFIYSATSIHMTYHRDWFETYHDKNNGAKIYLSDDKCYQIKCYGDMCDFLKWSCETNQECNVCSRD